jgi:hypothetical protein
MDPLLRRRLVLRILGGFLVAAWAAHAILAAAAPPWPGQAGVVGFLLAGLPVALAALAVIRPVRVRRERHGIAAIWLGLAAVLLTVPLAGMARGDAATGGSLDAVPALEAVYGFGLALAATALFGLLGVLQRRRRERVPSRPTVVRALALATGLALAGSLVFANVERLAGDARDVVSEASRYGPTDPDAPLPGCGTLPALGETAALRMVGRGSIDGALVADAYLSGMRDGRDESWTGDWSPPEGAVADVPGEPMRQSMGYTRIGDEAWLSRATVSVGSGTLARPEGAGGTPWEAVPADPFGLRGPDALTVDGPPLGTLADPQARAGDPVVLVVEDRGVEIVDGARARHCAALVDGPAALDTFVVLRWLIGEDGLTPAVRLSQWRGELDWWVFGDGALGRARLNLGGFAGDAWPLPGRVGVLEAEVVALDRGEPVSVEPPAGTLQSEAR